ncbi:ParB/RepB/Spo0J family partition protein [Vallitalea guaymasensis]|uniref:ParB/RepB/Spo0J family partition protein n=1 Tax=Vallitalea guaymasensis TaxID=1185412 RepID=UPI0023548CD0|nr:ParB/RepB/Spo0J family partition protein [Vallitalea guaymasensis]
MNKFNLNALLSSSSINATDKQNNKINKIKIIPISVHDLIPSNNNFYSVEEIAALKDSIEMFGLKQNLTVKALDNGKYRVIAGHRRFLASLALVEEGKEEFEMVPCSIETNINDIKEELILITTNSTTRQLSDWEKTQQAQRIKGLLQEYRKQEKISGRTREIIAQILDTSPTQISRMESISKHLTEEFKQEFQQDNINISTAYELSTLPEQVQQEIIEEYEDTGTLSIQDIKDKKADIKTNKDDSMEQEQEQESKDKLEKIEESHQKPELEVQRQHNTLTPIFPTIHKILKDMSKQELAKFICQRCQGSGFCDYFAECNYSSIDKRTEICEKWLDMQVQKGMK